MSVNGFRAIYVADEPDRGEQLALAFLRQAADATGCVVTIDMPKDVVRVVRAGSTLLAVSRAETPAGAMGAQPGEFLLLSIADLGEVTISFWHEESGRSELAVMMLFCAQALLCGARVTEFESSASAVHPLQGQWVTLSTPGWPLAPVGPSAWPKGDVWDFCGDPPSLAGVINRRLPGRVADVSFGHCESPVVPVESSTQPREELAEYGDAVEGALVALGDVSRVGKSVLDWSWIVSRDGRSAFVELRYDDFLRAERQRLSARGPRKSSGASLDLGNDDLLWRMLRILTRNSSITAAAAAVGDVMAAEGDRPLYRSLNVQAQWSD